MFVNAPYRATNGTTEVRSPLGVRLGSGSVNRFPSEGDALAAQHTFTHVPTFPSGKTTRSLLQSGRTGPDSFRNTPYNAEYRRINSEGKIFTLTRWGTGSEFGLEVAGLTYSLSANPDSGLTISDPSGSVHPEQGSLINRAIVFNLQQKTQAEAKNKLAHAEIDMAEALSGLPQTVAMVAEQTMRFVYAYRSVRNGNYALAAKHLGITRKNFNFKSASSAWLEYQYGWKPLASDIFGGIAQVNKLLAEPTPHAIAVRRQHQGLIVTQDITTRNREFFPGIHGEAGGEVFVEVKLRGRINNSTLALLTSLQLLNPLYQVWVSTPFSFVVDWIIPVGDWLSSITAPLGLTFTDGYMSTVTSGYATAQANKRGRYVTGSSPVREWDNTLARAEAGFMRRQVFNTWPWPTPYIRLPSTSPERVASAIALTKTLRR